MLDREGSERSLLDLGILRIIARVESDVDANRYIQVRLDLQQVRLCGWRGGPQRILSLYIYIYE